MEVNALTGREMRALEINAEYFGVSSLQLMENAGCSVAHEIATRFQPKKTRVAVFCGLGGNGGDGFVAARHLISLGYRVVVVLAGRSTDINHPAAKKNWVALQSFLSRMETIEVSDSSQVPKIKADVVVDALLGTGLKKRMREPILKLVETLNLMEAFHLSVDVPTGLDSDTGEMLGEAVRADLTVTFHKVKPGLLKAEEYVGALLIKDIGLPAAIEKFAGPGDVTQLVKLRPREAHKGDFGSLLVVGGSETYSGAPTLVALAALRTGVDLAYVAAPERTAQAISSISPNIITIKLAGSNLNLKNIPQIKQILGRVTAAVVGPGLGLQAETKRTVGEVVNAAEEAGIPLLLDADGLKAFAEFKRSLQVPLVLTPHTREYTVLSGKELPPSLVEKTERVKKTAAKLNAVVLLKGSPDIISDGEEVKLNFTGNPGMTVGGTGDVLSGIIGAFMAQQANHFEAAVAGTFINGAAGDFSINEKGYHIVATDLLDWIPEVMDNPMSHLQVQKNAT